MPIVEIGQYQLRFNEVTRNFQHALGADWVDLGQVVVPALQVVGAVSFDIAGTFTPPTLTTAQRNAITATEGMTIYNTTTHKLNVFTGTIWEQVTSA